MSSITDMMILWQFITFKTLPAQHTRYIFYFWFKLKFFMQNFHINLLLIAIAINVKQFRKIHEAKLLFFVHRVLKKEKLWSCYNLASIECIISLVILMHCWSPNYVYDNFYKFWTDRIVLYYDKVTFPSILGLFKVYSW